MKFLVDKLPNTCGECDYCATALMPSQLGIPKQVYICTLHTLKPPKNTDDQPILLDISKSPVSNYCPCSDEESGKIVDVATTPIKSSIVV